jgi:hypothetical protein
VYFISEVLDPIDGFVDGFYIAVVIGWLLQVYLLHIDFPGKGEPDADKVNLISRIQLLIKLSELEQRLMAGCLDKIQLGSFVSAFQVLINQLGNSLPI